MLENHGYALTGPPDVERLASFLPKVVGSAPPWQAHVAESISARVDGPVKFGKLNEALERLVKATAQVVR